MIFAPGFAEQSGGFDRGADAVAAFHRQHVAGAFDSGEHGPSLFDEYPTGFRQRCAARQTLDGAAVVVLAVQDTGSGIAPEEPLISR